MEAVLLDDSRRLAIAKELDWQKAKQAQRERQKAAATNSDADTATDTADEEDEPPAIIQEVLEDQVCFSSRDDKSCKLTRPCCATRASRLDARLSLPSSATWASRRQMMNGNGSSRQRR